MVCVQVATVQTKGSMKPPEPPVCVGFAWAWAGWIAGYQVLQLLSDSNSTVFLQAIFNFQTPDAAPIISYQTTTISYFSCLQSLEHKTANRSSLRRSSSTESRARVDSSHVTPTPSRTNTVT